MKPKKDKPKMLNQKKKKAAKMTVLLELYMMDNIKNANVIPKIIKRLESEKVSIAAGAITGLRLIFGELLTNGDIKVIPKKPDNVTTANEKFGKWLHSQYDKTFQKLLGLLKHEAPEVHAHALHTIVMFIRLEGKHPIKADAGDDYPFPKYRLQPLIKELVSTVEDQRHLINLVTEYMAFPDFMYYTLIVLYDMLKKKTETVATEIYMYNLFLLLENISLEEEGMEIPGTRALLDEEEEEPPAPEPMEGDAEEEEEEEPKEAFVSKFSMPYKKAKEAINLIWPKVLKLPLTHDLYRRCLIHIPDKVMPHLYKPIMLTDFFMESYDIGGAISLLALQGVFILIHKHNLEYPEFYKKLYALLEPTIFYAKYKPRFFMLLDKFLSSTHLPEYLMAAFIKRLSRLALVAPAPSQILLMKFISNLLLRSRGLKKLMHDPTAQALDDDPYDPEEPDPAKCCATESSLWEMKMLQSHGLPAVRKAAQFTKKNLPDIEHDIGMHVETTYEEMFEHTCKLKVFEDVAKTFYKPQGLFSHQDDQMAHSWTLV